MSKLAAMLLAFYLVWSAGCSPEPIDSTELSGMRVAILIGEGMYSTGATDTARYLRARGAEAVFIGERGGEVKPYNTPNESIAVEQLVRDVQADDFHGLVIPGGMLPPFFGERFNAGSPAVRLVNELVAQGKVVAAVCTGVMLLIQADAVKERRVTGPSVYRDAAVGVGATWIDSPVVVDGNLVTGQPTDSLTRFCQELVKALKSGK